MAQSMDVRRKIISKCERIKELDNIYTSQLKELAHGMVILVESI